MIPETFMSTGISTSDIVTNNRVHHIELGTLHDDETVVAGSKNKVYCLNRVDSTFFHDVY